MSKIEKILERFIKIPKDLTWDELTAILNYFEYRALKTGKTGGSRRKFTDKNNNIISLHKPHPGNIVKEYVIRQVKEQLKEKGKIK